MSDRIVQISASGVKVTAELNDSVTAGALWDALPVTGRAQTWGDEIYFSIQIGRAHV